MNPRLSKIQLQWFRGAAVEAVLAPESRSIVVYGPNGAGKSSWVDALEYIISGRIDHLAHEYSGSRQERALRNTHAPPDASVLARMELDSGAFLEVSISPNGQLRETASDATIKSAIARIQRQHLILRQDEMARFVHSSKGDKYSALLPLLGLDGYEVAAENLRKLKKKVAEVAKLEKLQNDISFMERSLKEQLGAANHEAVLAALHKLSARYLSVGVRNTQATTEEIEQAVEGRIREQDPRAKLHLLAGQVLECGVEESVAELRTELQNVHQQRIEDVESLIGVLEATQRVLFSSSSSTEEMLCPSCGRPIPRDSLSDHVEAELKKWTAQREELQVIRRVQKDLATRVGNLRNLLRSGEIKDWLAAQEPEIRDAPQRFLNEEIDVPPGADLNGVLVRVQEAYVPFSKAIRALKAQEPPAVALLLQDQKMIQAAKMLPVLEKKQAEVAAVQATVGFLSAMEEAVRSALRAQAERVLNEISADIQELWGVLHPGEPIESVHLYSVDDKDKAIDVGLRFFGVPQESPRLTLSEGHRNSLGLCIFLSLRKRAPIALNTIVLDDVVSSFDRAHRGALVDLLELHFSNTQILILTHDREWFSELRRRLPMPRWKFQTLKPWSSPKEGLSWLDSTDGLEDALVMAGSSPEAAANRARAAMDSELAFAAEQLELRLPFLRGDKNDARGAAEFLERLAADSKKRLKIRTTDGTWSSDDRSAEAFEAARTLLITWGNRGSHGGSVSPQEARRLEAVS